MCQSSAPTPPDPKATAAATTGTDIGTAIANATIGNVNQVTPEGNLTYSQSGSSTYTDPYTGQSYQIPSYTATQTLSPSGQATQDQIDATKLNLGTTANTLSSAASTALATPLDLSAANVAKYMDTSYQPLFNTQWGQNQTALNSSLADKGITQGSTAYTNAQNNFSTQENTAWDQLTGSQYQNAVGNIVTQQNQPLNELTGLLSGSQLANPSYVNANEPTIPTTNDANDINQSYQDQVGAYNTSTAQSNSWLGGLFGLGSSLIMSDERTKTDIERIGKTDDGQNIYSYRYKVGGPTQIGLMAQEVEKVHPEAVEFIPGTDIRAVDYSKALGSTFGGA